MTTSEIQVHGEVADGFGAVADAFAANFELRGELGAAFSLYVDGVERVNVWAGIADQRAGRAWTDDTLQLVFSTTKGAVAICIANSIELVFSIMASTWSRSSATPEASSDFGLEAATCMATSRASASSPGWLDASSQIGRGPSARCQRASSAAS